MEGLVRSVLGHVGAPRSGVPADRGPACEAWADVMEEPEGIALFLSVEPQRDTSMERAVVRLLSSAGQPLPARAPFAAADGGFALSAPITNGSAGVFLPWGVLIDPPARAHALVIYVQDGEVRGHTAFDVEPQVQEPLTTARYVRPVAQLAWAVAAADGPPEPAERTSLYLQLEGLFVLDDAARAEIDALIEAPPPSLRRLAVSTWCRFPDLDSEELFFGLIGVAASDGHVSAAEIDVISRIARHLEVGEPAWRRWAHRMGVDLPAPEGEATPPRRQVSDTVGRRLVPSVILRLDPEGQDRRNPAATWSMLTGVGAVVLMFVGFAGGLTPWPAVLAVLVLPTQLLLAVLALGLGVVGYRRSRTLDGAGEGASVTGVGMALLCFLLLGTLLVAACLGLGTSAVLENGYGL